MISDTEHRLNQRCRAFSIDQRRVMTLLDSKPPKPITGIRKHVPLPILILTLVLMIILGALLAFRFWNIKQERVVQQFLVTLEQGDYRHAYQLWQPATSYTYDNFVHDWGPQGDY